MALFPGRHPTVPCPAPQAATELRGKPDAIRYRDSFVRKPVSGLTPPARLLAVLIAMVSEPLPACSCVTAALAARLLTARSLHAAHLHGGA